MSENTKSSLLVVFILLIVALVLSIVETGIAVNEGDHPIHLAYVYKAMNPDLFPNDPFVATVEQYPSIFWKAIAAVAGIGIPLNIMLYGGHLLFRMIAVCGLFFLYRELARRSFSGSDREDVLIAIAGTFVTLGFNVIHWGGTFMLEGTLETSTAAFSVLPWVWYFWIRRAWPAWAVTFGAVAWIHPMVGMYIGLIFAAVWIAEGDLYNPTSENGKLFWLKGGIPAGILSASAVFYAWLQRTPMEPGMKEAWVVISRYRLSHHLFPAGWPLSQFAIWIIIAATLLTACVYTTSGKLRAALVAGFIPVAGLAVLGLIAPEVFPDPTLLSLCLWRSPMAWTVVAFGLLVPFGLKIAGSMLKPSQLLWPAVALSLLFLLVLSAFKYQRRQAYSDSPGRAAVAEWIRESTPTDSVILAPPVYSGIRTEMRRTSFVEWKDGSAILWDPVYTRDVWMQRLALLAGERRIDEETGLERPPTATEASEDYSRLLEEPERLKQIAADNDIDFVLVDETVDEEFRNVMGDSAFQQDGWAVYRLSD